MMFMIIKKKHISIALGCFLCLTVLTINILSSGNMKSAVKTSQEHEKLDNGETIAVYADVTDYISEAKNNRDIARSKACEMLKETLNNKNISDESRLIAEKNLINMAEFMDIENKCESIMASKGYTNSVVFVTDKSVTVTVKKSDMSDNDIMKINDIIFEQTGNNNIKVVEVN